MAARTVTHRLPGMTLTGHTFTVPLDYARPDGETIQVFAREVAPAGREDADLPWLVFFQGGPGFPSPRPATRSGWIKRALKDYRVLLLDQRGTGRSTPVTLESLGLLHNARAMADHLKHFRADSIVRDAERIRRELVGADRPWSVLGQSFGGFCVTHYLSAAPGGLREAIITGGLPPIGHTVDDIYRATSRRILDKNAKYYARYPEDVDRAAVLMEWISREDVRLPAGDRLTPWRFQQLGHHFGASDGFETVHYLLEEQGWPFLRGVEQAQSFDTNPIYAILHEACYCERGASNWAAARVLPEFAEFTAGPERRVTFTGEMIFPWMFTEYRRLAPLREAAEILARFDGWPALYDPAVLRANRVPCAAAMYYDDMYVERAFAEETAAMIGGIKTWVTNEYEHNALRADGQRVLDRLLAMLRGATA
jgi:pimeloyl-ACP methyl ester carboxylesterase